MKQLLKLTLLLLALLLPATATAYDFRVDGIYYNIINDNEVEVTQYNFGDYSGDITIPTTVTYNNTTYSVTAIGHNAFDSCYSLTGILIPNSINTIGEWAFFDCSELTCITIPNSVTFIDECAFLSCGGLTSILVENGNPNYDSRENCNAIIETASNKLIRGCQNTIIPNSINSIGNYAFNYSTGLTSLIIPNSVVSIGWCAFEGCSGLININIPDSVTAIEDNTFSYCSRLANINIPESVTSIGLEAFINCSDLTKISIPNSVISIGEFAFGGCTGLTSITIPNSVTTIWSSAFSGCSGLTSIIVENDNTKFDSRESCNAIIETASNTLIQGCQNTTIPYSVTSIGESAFSSCSELTNITIPNSVTSIGSGAFYDCNKLNEVYSRIINPSGATMGPSVFNRYPNNYYIRTLYVPYGTLEAYQQDTRWSQYFGAIVEMDPFPVESIELDREATVLVEGETLQLTATVLPEDAYYKTVTWATSSPEVARVDSEGLVTAVSVGSATITAVTADGSNLSASCAVTVRSLSASECFTMDDLTAFHGDTIVIPVKMVNEANIISFQTDIYLPKGLELLQEDGEYLIDPSSRMTSTHSLMSNAVSNGSIRVVCYSANYKPFKGESGEDLFYITVKVADNAEGDYTVRLKNTLFTTNEFEEIAVPDAAAIVNVKAYIPGDANDSGNVTVTDVVVTSQYILEMNPEPFNFTAADVNTDGSITVTDVSRIAWIVLNPTLNAPLRAPALWNNGDLMSGNGITLAAGETRRVSIALDNAMDYNAFQFDLRLPTGLTASNFAVTDRASSHAFDVNTLKNGDIRVLCYSPVLTAISGNEGALLTFDVTATAAVNADITVDGIELVTTGCQTVKLDAFAIGVNTATSVNETAIGKDIANIEYFNLAGQRITEPTTGVTLVVTTYTDGTRTTTKLIK